MHNLKLSIGRRPIATDTNHFGTLHASDTIALDGEALRNRLSHDGYLYLRGVLDRAAVLAARQECMERLMMHGALQPGSDPLEGIANEGANRYYFMETLAEKNEPLLKVLYGGAMMALMERLFNATVRHFDYTWMRAVGPGNGTHPHCDAVYMNRGTDQLVTAWTPLGDIPVTQGGLVILENSHQEREAKLAHYLRQDVDSYCKNGPNAEAIQSGKMNWEHYNGSYQEWSGALDDDANQLQEVFGGRWLTSPEYRMGDVLIFTMATVHASLDNASDRIRLSSDTRYQPVDLPVDERWVEGESGQRPIGHGLQGKRGKIC